MADLDRRPLPEVRVDLEMIHQPTSAQDAKPHAALRAILSVQNSLDVGNTRSLVRNPDIEDLRHRCRVEDKFSSSASSVAEGVPRQFRDSSCYAGLVLALKTQKVGQSVGALPNSDDVSLAFDRDRHDWPCLVTRGHGR